MVYTKEENGKTYAVDYNVLTGKMSLTVENMALAKVKKRLYSGTDEEGNSVTYSLVGNVMKGVSVITPQNSIIEVVPKLGVAETVLYVINFVLVFVYSFAFGIIGGLLTAVVATGAVVGMLALHNTKLSKGAKMASNIVMTLVTALMAVPSYFISLALVGAIFG